MTDTTRSLLYLPLPSLPPASESGRLIPCSSSRRMRRLFWLYSMFSKAIILIASYRKGVGDSGSRHAMEAAGKYEIERYAMYNSNVDDDNKRFGLNKDLVSSKGVDQVKILIPSFIDLIKSIKVRPHMYSHTHLMSTNTSKSTWYISSRAVCPGNSMI